MTWKSVTLLQNNEMVENLNFLFQLAKVILMIAYIQPKVLPITSQNDL